MSSPEIKNISLPPSGKSVAGYRPSCPEEGRRPSSPTLGQDAVDAFGVRRVLARWTKTPIADGEVVWSWRRDAGVKLAGSIPPMTVTTSPLTGESTKETVKTVRVRECRDVPGGPVVITLVCFFNFARETAGALGARHSPRPQGAEEIARLGHIVPRECPNLSSPAKAGDPVFQRQQ